MELNTFTRQILKREVLSVCEYTCNYTIQKGYCVDDNYKDEREFLRFEIILSSDNKLYGSIGVVSDIKKTIEKLKNEINRLVIKNNSVKKQNFFHKRAFKNTQTSQKNMYEMGVKNEPLYYAEG